MQLTFFKVDTLLNNAFTIALTFDISISCSKYMYSQDSRPYRGHRDNKETGKMSRTCDLMIALLISFKKPSVLAWAVYTFWRESALASDILLYHLRRSILLVENLGEIHFVLPKKTSKRMCLILTLMGIANKVDLYKIHYHPSKKKVLHRCTT